MTKPTLIYFAARGRGEVIRLVLAEADVDYAEHIVGSATPPVDGRPTDFAALKAGNTLPFGALPVWEEEGLRLAQSGAIANYLARKHGMRGKSILDEARIDEMLGAVDDVRLELRRLVTATAESRPAQRAELLQTTLPRWLGFLERQLRQNRDGEEFAVGDSITVADLALWSLLEVIHDNGFDADLSGAPALAAFFKRIAKRPRLAAYLASPKRHPLKKLPA